MRNGRSFVMVARLSVGIAALVGSAAGLAQNTAPSAWQPAPAAANSDPTVSMYLHKELADRAILMVSVLQSPDHIPNLVTNIDAACKGIARASERSVLGGKMKLFSSAQGPAHCAVGFYQQGDQWRSVFVLKSPTADISAEDAAQQWAMQYVGGPASPKAAASSTTAAAPSAPAAAASGGSLAQALAAVPQAHRPVALVMRSEWRSSGLSGGASFSPWLLFPNGYATDGECYGWDPATVAPTRQALAGAGLDCSVERWRKVGNQYQFQDSDGTWDDPVDASDFYAIGRGKTLDAAMETQDGAGSSAGSVSVNMVSQGSLRLTKAGDIAVGSWGGTWLKGDQRSERGAAMRGRYYLDGFLIAVADQNGNVSRGFIAAANSKGQLSHIYLNGTLYWVPGASGG